MLDTIIHIPMYWKRGRSRWRLIDSLKDSSDLRERWRSFFRAGNGNPCFDRYAFACHGLADHRTDTRSNGASIYLLRLRMRFAARADYRMDYRACTDTEYYFYRIKQQPRKWTAKHRNLAHEARRCLVRLIFFLSFFFKPYASFN